MELIKNPSDWHKLRCVSSPFKIEELEQKETLELAIELFNYLDKTPNAVGISAPQLGVFKRMFAVKEKSGPIALINPVILKEKGSKKVFESCMSFEHMHVLVTRAAKIQVAYVEIQSSGKILNRIFELNFDDSFKFKKLDSERFQHELDHLDGITIFDRYMGSESLNFKTPRRRINKISLEQGSDYFVQGNNKLMFSGEPVPEQKELTVGYYE